MANNIPDFPPFNVHLDSNAGPRWEKWLKRVERLFIGMNLDDKKQKRALLLHYAGPDVDDIFDTLPDTGENDDYDTAVEKLNEYFNPQVNTTYEVYSFRMAKQKEGESLDSYHTRLRQLAKTCQFADQDKEIKDHIILTCTSNALRRRALRDDFTLANLLKHGRALEMSESQASEVEKTDFQANTVNRIRQKSVQHVQSSGRFRSRARQPNSQSRNRPMLRNRENNQQKDTTQITKKMTCWRCGGDYPHRNECPAINKECHSCGKIGHFSRICKTNPRRPNRVRNVTLDKKVNEHLEEDEDEYLYSVKPKNTSNLPSCDVLIANTPVKVMIDSGATVNLINEATFHAINKKNTLKLEDTKHKIYPYGSRIPIPVKGKTSTDIKFQTKITAATVFVVQGDAENLLSCDTSKELGILQIKLNAVTCNNHNLETMLKEFDCLFEPIEKIKGKVIKLHIDDNVPPKHQPHRRLPFHIRADVEKELERLEKLDIIEEVTGPTPWVSPIVVVPKKSGEVRICVDMREANQAIQREKHPMPTLDELAADLNGATCFSKLDLSSGYHQFELHPDSRHITTFSTHKGLRRFKRLIFGVNAASEIFQNALEEILSGLQGCKNLSDDIIVYGKDQDEHDKNLNATLTRLKEMNVHLNKSKCKFSQAEIPFYGHIFSAEGMKPDPLKVEAIKNANPPQNSSEVKSFLGMSQYVSRYIQNYADITAPLRNLTKQDTTWKWEEGEQIAFDNVTRALTGDEVMSYFNAEKKTEIVVDASPVGLGAILLQEGKVISYASRILTDPETRYSQTEREMLAAVWGVEKFHLFVYGSTFDVITDHKPLLGILPSHKPTSARMDRWKLRLAPYNCNIVYRPGKDDKNPADFLSRHPNTRELCDDHVAEDYVNYVCRNAVPKAMTLQEIKRETKVDTAMQALAKAIENEEWTDPIVQGFKNIKDELSIYNGIILRGNRIVIPNSLQEKAVDLAHIGHQGIGKTKALIREKVWFSGIDKMVENKIRNCLACQATTTRQETREPVKSTVLPKAPWKEISIDFCGPFPSGDCLLVVIDDYSRFPEVEILTSTSARAVIPKLDAIFSRQGIPDIVKSDNGPPFNGAEFKAYAEQSGFHHRRITPYWPRANGEAERFMSTIEKAIRTAHIEKKNWKQEMYKFLRQYRATPHSSTDISPSEALNQRKLKTELPQITSTITATSKLQQKDAESKFKMAHYADQRARAKENFIKPGDTVLVRQPKQNKLSTPYNTSPFIVEERKGTMITASNGNKSITRNSSQFKQIPHQLARYQPEEDDDDSSINEIPPANALQEEAKSQSPPAMQRRSSNRQVRQPIRFSDYVMYK